MGDQRPYLDLTSQEWAIAQDREDPLAEFRDRFYRHPRTIYMDGNSLGLMSRDAEQQVTKAMNQWRELMIDGWLSAEPPWFTNGEVLGERSAALVGAKPEEVVVTGTTTINQHALVSTFYQPEDNRRKIVATALDFPSDIYALQSQINLRGGNPEYDLVQVESRDGRIIEEEDIIAAMTDDVALIVLPSVLYRSGQLLDMARLTQAAHEREILIGFDCAHSAGAVPHQLHDWSVDFAYWCNYKYLNAGPGSVGSLFVHEQHFGMVPGMTGWWGYNKERQFDMLHTWESASGAAAWQISTTPLFATVPLRGSLDIFEAAGMDRIRAKSLHQTEYLMTLLETNGLLDPPYYYQIGTPREETRRGGHVAIEHSEGMRIARALKQRGIIPDFRQPNVVRLAPVALYTTYEEIWNVAQQLKAIIDSGAYLEMKEQRDLVS